MLKILTDYDFSRWNDFESNISTSFRELREDKDFSDVTLACEDGEQFDAHKVILVASSPFFQHLLKINRHAHPLIFMSPAYPMNRTVTRKTAFRMRYDRG